MDEKEDKCNRVAIFIISGSIERSASLINFIKSLSIEGYIIDVFSLGDFKGVFNQEYKNINFISDIKNEEKIKKLKRIVRLDSIVFSSSKWYRRFGYLKLILNLHYIYYMLKNNEYMCFIGVEKLGLIIADLVNNNKVPIIYYSLELYYSEPSGKGRLMFNAIRRLELNAHHNAKATIIQDRERASVLFEYNKIPEYMQEILFLPVSMIGGSFKKRTNFFYETLGIPRDKKIILQLSMIASSRMSLDIAKSTRNWPEDWVLVMHGIFEQGIEHQIKNLNHRCNIYISKEKLRFEDIPKAVASAHIGLVFYKNDTDFNYYNNYYIGSSSGQLAHHLQCGIPIITLNIPSLRRVVDGCQCGLAVDDPDLIKESAKMIFKNYEFFRENAFRCFEERYQFEKNFDNINIYIKSLSKT